MTPRATGLLLLLATTIGWGSNWPLLKLLLAEMPPFAARAYAGFLGALLVALLARSRGVALWVPRAEWGRLSVFSFLNVTAWMGFTTVAMTMIAASEGAIIAYTMPVWASLLAWAMLGERLSAAKLGALALGAAGVGLLFGGAGFAPGGGWTLGAGLILAAALLFALGAVVAKRRPLGLPPLPAVAWQLFLGCLPLMLLSLALERVAWGALSATAWFCFLWMAVVSLGMSYVTWFGALARLPASTAALGTLLAPVIGTFGAGLILGEPLGWRQLGALACIVGGVALAVRPDAGGRPA